ncbi:MAG: hypothetical protein ABR500_00150 [Dermatophilaceae bacterium]|nr:TOP6B-like family protein [Intrasporangiaceae bacterium]
MSRQSPRKPASPRARRTPVPPAARLSPRRAELLEAHVRFELESWSGPGLQTVIRDEVAALYAWLASVRLEDILPAGEAAPVSARLVEQLRVTEETAAALADILETAVDAIADSDLRVRDLARRQDVLALADTAARLDRIREELIGAVTASTAYRHLVAHVLYRGVKDYVLTENVLARRIPGASSLVRFGQRGLHTAAPGLEQAVDRQLSAFVEANIAETLRESRRYLEATLDARMMRVLAEETWAELAPRRVADLAALADEEDVERLTRDLIVLAEHALATGLLSPLVERAVHDLLTRSAHRSPADLLREIGVDEEGVAKALTQAADLLTGQPAVRRFIEDRVRARLMAFYADPGCPADD